MARFARSGRNWEGRSWTLNPALDALGSQIEDAWPESHATDGTAASKGHDQTNPNSDHRPYPYTGSGVVYALDMGEVTENDGAILCEQLRLSRDPRIKYVIHEGRMFSSYSTSYRRAWEWGDYGGSNEHLNHVHVSVWRTAGPGQWAITLGDDMADHDHKVTFEHDEKPWGDVPWEWFQQEQFTNHAPSRTWEARREDNAYQFKHFYDRYIRPLQQELSAQAAEIERLRNLGSSPHDHPEYVEKGRSYRIG